jgi:hypothetical protein
MGIVARTLAATLQRVSAGFPVLRVTGLLQAH